MRRKGSQVEEMTVVSNKSEQILKMCENET